LNQSCNREGLTMLKKLSFQNWLRRRSALPQLAISAVLLLVLAATASAYTIVFRSGQRLEIPAEFTVTNTTLTYEISPGFNKTLLLSIIDVAKTERVNGEAPGSFFKRREQRSTTPAPTEPAPKAVKTLTNIDLDAVRQRRVDSERAYEVRQEVESAELRAQLREESFNKRQEESYWRGRARQLRTEIAAVDTQINYLRGRINELNQSALNNQSIITGIYPIWPNNRPWLGNGQWGIYPNVYPNGYPNVYPNGYPNVYPNAYPRLPGYRPARPPYGLGYPYPNIYGYPGLNDNSANSTQQSDLTYRLDDLLVRRAGLLAGWRTLEDEARDARVPQVWLEP
jgi:hypothetical protein